METEEPENHFFVVFFFLKKLSYSKEHNFHWRPDEKKGQGKIFGLRILFFNIFEVY